MSSTNKITNEEEKIEKSKLAQASDKILQYLGTGISKGLLGSIGAIYSVQNSIEIGNFIYEHTDSIKGLIGEMGYLTTQMGIPALALAVPLGITYGGVKGIEMYVDNLNSQEQDSE
jgi:hypothetical protein